MAQPIAEVSGINASVVVTRTRAAGDDEFLVQLVLPDFQLELFGRQARALAAALKFMTGDAISFEELSADPELRIWFDSERPES